MHGAVCRAGSKGGIMPLDKLTRIVSLDALSPDQASVIEAVRVWALMTRMRRSPDRAVAEKLGSRPAATQCRLLLSEVAAAWPDRLCVSPPCSEALSHDEETLLAMVDAAGRGDRPGFDRLLADLLPAEQRQHLYICARMFSRAARP
ncbi:hypothetical protein [Sphingomonas sp.]|jgi:hypothetical protein|uniref:hypothetical protein n=1 Tax=Sphingomonas sp. TaxID=28214 RepID=UPI002FCB6CFC